MAYFAEYRPTLGFKFALDGIHNAPSGQPYAGLFMLNPPGTFYNNPSDTNQVHLASLLDWDGPLTSPRFLNGFYTFKGIEAKQNTHIIVDIRAINLSKKTPQITNVGWTIVPLFNADGYVMSGMYQIPLIAGEVNKAIVQSLATSKGNPWEIILQNINLKKSNIKWLSNASIMIRLLDCQREVDSV